MTQPILVNEKINSSQVRLIDFEGKQLGILSKNEALNMARDQGLDLVMIAPSSTSSPPVCKILDANKFLYENKKREKENSRKQRASVIETKEIHLRPVTDKHDIEIKCRKAKEFLEAGDKVKILLKFRGREVQHKQLGFELLNSIVEKIENAKVEKPIQDQGRDLVILLAPEVKKVV